MGHIMGFIKALAGFFALFLVAFMGYAIYDHNMGSNAFTPPTANDVFTPLNPEVAAVLKVHEEALATEMTTAVLPQIDETLELIKTEYGEKSVEYTKALSEVALVISEEGRKDLAIPYMTKALELSRAVYGNQHRETALVLNDLASLKIFNSSNNFSPEAIPLLQEAIAIREDTIGDNHPETYGARMTLADMFFLKWQSAGEDPASPLLDEGIIVAQKANEAIEADPNANTLQYMATGLLWGRFAYAKQDYALAKEVYASALPDPTQIEEPAYIILFEAGYSEYIDALRQTGEDDVADKFTADIQAVLQRATAPATAAEIAPEAPTE
jgi:hypothetical protein